GVPAIAPVAAFKVAQLGNPCADQVRAPVPPVAASCAEYGAPIVPAGSSVVVTLEIGFTVAMKFLEVVTPTESVAVTLKLKSVRPETTGAIPESAPCGVMESHAGSPVTVKVIA